MKIFSDFMPYSYYRHIASNKNAVLLSLSLLLSWCYSTKLVYFYSVCFFHVILSFYLVRFHAYFLTHSQQQQQKFLKYFVYAIYLSFFSPEFLTHFFFTFIFFCGCCLFVFSLNFNYLFLRFVASPWINGRICV